MSSTKYADEYEHYNFDHDKYIYSGHGGKQRTKKEASEHTNHADPSGHSRKILTKLMNTEANHKRATAAVGGGGVVVGVAGREQAAAAQ